MFSRARSKRDDTLPPTDRPTMLILTSPPMTLRSNRLSRPRSPQILRGHARVRARPIDRSTSIVAPVDQQAKQAAWLSGRVLRLQRQKLTSRLALAASILAILLVSFLASAESFNPLEQAQAAQSAIATQVTELVGQTAP